MMPSTSDKRALLHLAKGRRRRVAKWSLCPCSGLQNHPKLSSRRPSACAQMSQWRPLKAPIARCNSAAQTMLLFGTRLAGAVWAGRDQEALGHRRQGDAGLLERALHAGAELAGDVVALGRAGLDREPDGDRGRLDLLHTPELRVKGAQTRSCSLSVLVEQAAKQVASLHSAAVILA
jgi:hypothetical protein